MARILPNRYSRAVPPAETRNKSPRFAYSQKGNLSKSDHGPCPMPRSFADGVEGRTIDRAPERYRRVTYEHAHASSQDKNLAGRSRPGAPNGL
jgi:hypothetical protein